MITPLGTPSLGTSSSGTRIATPQPAALSATSTAAAPTDSVGPSTAPLTIDAAKAASILFQKQRAQPLEKRWEIRGIPFGGPLADSKGTLYASLNDRRTVASILPESGLMRWTADIEGCPTSRPVLTPDEKLLLVCAGDGRLHALDSTSGTEAWSAVATGLPQIGEDGQVYVWGAGKLTKIDLDSHSAAQTTQLRIGVGFEAAPAVGRDGTIYLGGHDGLLYALEPGTARVKWTCQTGGMLRNSPVVGPDDTVYAGCIGKALVAVDPKDGREKWRTPTEHWILPEAVIGDDGTVYVGCSDNKIYALNPNTGEPRWTFETNAEIRVNPVPARDGMIYVVSDRNRLYGLDQRSGAEQWSMELDSYMACPPAVDHRGGLVMGINNGKTCAYRHNITALRVQRLEALKDAEACGTATQAPPAPTIEQHDDWVVVGGVRVPVNHREA